jgi:hypothetical protein
LRVLTLHMGRVVSDEHRKKVFVSAARVRATFLVADAGGEGIGG